MDYQEAIEILHPDTRWAKLGEIDYFGGLNGSKRKMEADSSARVLACEAMQELQDIKSQMDDDLKIHISELRQAKHDTETFWEEPTALSKALQNAIRALLEIQQYKQIGALEEVRAAVEKQKAKKIQYDPNGLYGCPTCKRAFNGHAHKYDYCPYCNQKLVWGD